jgi:hypothetical protein
MTRKAIQNPRKSRSGSAAPTAFASNIDIHRIEGLTAILAPPQCTKTTSSWPQ